MQHYDMKHYDCVVNNYPLHSTTRQPLSTSLPEKPPASFSWKGLVCANCLHALSQEPSKMLQQLSHCTDQGPWELTLTHSTLTVKMGKLELNTRIPSLAIDFQASYHQLLGLLYSR